MSHIRIGALLPLAFSLLACSREPPPPSPPREADRALERAIQEPIDKARAVEAEVMKAKREQDAKIEEQGG